jgi:hypothetical protein
MTEIVPPWLQFSSSEYAGGPIWGGWRQGISEHWLLDTWLPFWKSQDSSSRERYLERWPPPTEVWRLYLIKGAMTPTTRND